MTAAAPAMSPFMSSMPAAGLIEMPPVSKTTPLPTKATGAASAAPPFQRSTTSAALVLGPLPDAEQRAHAEFGHRLFVEDLDLDAELHQLRGAAGEFRRRQDIGGLVDERAGQHHGLGRMRGFGDDGARALSASATPSCTSTGPSLSVVLLLGLVLVELIGAQPAAERELRRRRGGFGRRVRQIEQDDRRRALPDLGRGLARQAPDNPRISSGLSPSSPPPAPTPTISSRLAGDADGRENFERRADLALEFGRRRRRARSAPARP